MNADNVSFARSKAHGAPTDPATLAKIQQFYRLFLAPGMGHCGGGAGPNQFGQAGGDRDAEHDMVVALEKWVEKGVPPTRIVATKFVSDDKAKGVARPRPLCPFPQVAKYKGTGDIADAANFACAAPYGAPVGLTTVFE